MKPQQILVGILVLAALGLGAVLVFGRGDGGPLTLSGYIEGEPLYPASPVSGRLAALDVQRGDSVSPREGHLGSQKPHSMHLSTMASAAGSGLRCRRCACGSSLSSTPVLFATMQLPK